MQDRGAPRDGQERSATLPAPRIHPRTIARHEAGHAVVGLAVGETLESVRIGVEGDLGGVTEWRISGNLGPGDFDGYWYPVRYSVRLIIKWGGVEAERVVGRQSRAVYGLTTGTDDLREAMRLAELWVKENREDAGREVDLAGVECGRLIRRHWAAVRAVEEALLRDRFLSGSVATRIALEASGALQSAPCRFQLLQEWGQRSCEAQS